MIEKTYYKFNKSYFIGSSSLACESAIGILEVTKNYHKRTGKPIKDTIRFRYQGSLSHTSNKKYIDDLLTSGVLIEIEKPSDEFLNEWVYCPESLSRKRFILENAKLTFPTLEDVFKTLRTWIFSTKGSSCINKSEENKFQKNKEKVLEDTTLRGGMKAKPGKSHKNRSLRTTPEHNQEKWSNDDTTLLPNGIKADERASFSEMEKIFDKVISQFISMYDCPSDVIEYFETNCGIEKGEILIDYINKTPISITLFEQNTHHAKVKGLELCHIDPSLKYATRAENLCIGSCDSNRFQGGYALEDKEKRLRVMKIYDLKINKDTDYLNSLSLDELDRIYYEGKFENV